jgi:multidrug efflux system outer membrane protein
VPEQWKGEHVVSEQCPSVENWWEVFGDKTLDELETYAIYHSPNLYVALERVASARATAGISRADLFPQVTLNPSTTSTGLLYEFLGLQAFPVHLPPGFSNLVRIHQRTYELPVNLNYELDLWGRLRSQFESNLFAVEAEVEDYRNVFLTLTTDLASNYYLLRSLDAQIVVLREAIEVRQREFDLNQARFQKGIATLLDVTQAEQDYFQTKAIYDDNVRQREIQENVIAALLGIPASCFHLNELPLDGPPPMIPAGVPCSVILQRPDLSQLERTMASQHSLINEAYASFFPNFSLTGTLGFLSPQFSDFLRWQTRLWSWGTNLLQTVFDGGRLMSELDLAFANFKQASGTYQQQVVTAFKEVESALSDIEWQTKQSENLKASYLAAQKSADLSRSRYKNGVVNYLEVVINENTALNQQQSYINVMGQRYLSTVQLIKSLGGSWSCEE